MLCNTRGEEIYLFHGQIANQCGQTLKLNHLTPYSLFFLVYHNLAVAWSWLYNNITKCVLLLSIVKVCFVLKNKVRKTPHGHVIRHSVLFCTQTHSGARTHIYSPGSITQHFVAESLFTVTAG